MDSSSQRLDTHLITSRRPAEKAYSRREVFHPGLGSFDIKDKVRVLLSLNPTYKFTAESRPCAFLPDPAMRQAYVQTPRVPVTQRFDLGDNSKTGIALCFN